MVLENLSKITSVLIDDWNVTQIIGNYYLCNKMIISNKSGTIASKYPFEIELSKSLLHVQSQLDVLCYVNYSVTNNTVFYLDNNSQSSTQCFCEFLLYKVNLL